MSKNTYDVFINSESQNTADDFSICGTLILSISKSSRVVLYNIK